MDTPLTGYAPCGAASLYYERAGAGDPLVLIHAGIADSRMWDEHMEPFVRHYHVIRYDMRGFGRSSLPNGPFAHHEDLLCLLRFLGAERATVVGASFGGSVALNFTLEHPKMVRALILVNATIPGWDWSDSVQRFGEAEEAALARGDLEAATDLNVRMWADGPYRQPEQVDAQTRERIRIMQRRAFALANPDADERPLDPPALQRLTEIRAPALILVGEQDVPDMLAMAAHLAASIPHARLVSIPSAAHVPSMEQPALFQRLTSAFLEEIPR